LTRQSVKLRGKDASNIRTNGAQFRHASRQQHTYQLSTTFIINKCGFVCAVGTTSAPHQTFCSTRHLDMRHAPPGPPAHLYPCHPAYNDYPLVFLKRSRIGNDMSSMCLVIRQRHARSVIWTYYRVVVEMLSCIAADQVLTTTAAK